MRDDIRTKDTGQLSAMSLFATVRRVGLDATRHYTYAMTTCDECGEAFVAGGIDHAQMEPVTCSGYVPASTHVESNWLHPLPDFERTNVDLWDAARVLAPLHFAIVVTLDEDGDPDEYFLGRTTYGTDQWATLAAYMTLGYLPPLMLARELRTPTDRLSQRVTSWILAGCRESAARAVVFAEQATETTHQIEDTLAGRR